MFRHRLDHREIDLRFLREAVLAVLRRGRRREVVPRVPCGARRM